MKEVGAAATGAALEVELHRITLDAAVLYRLWVSQLFSSPCACQIVPHVLRRRRSAAGRWLGRRLACMRDGVTQSLGGMHSVSQVADGLGRDQRDD